MNMSMRLEGKRILSLVQNEFEDLELWYPVLRLQEEGAIVTIAGPEEEAFYRGKNGLTIRSEMRYENAVNGDWDALLIPGGWAPDKIRRSPDVIELVQKMDRAERPIGQICHAGWVLASAGILKGRKVTSTPGIRDDLENAGAEWMNEPVVVDRNLVSSRRPPDLPDYLVEFIGVVEHYRVDSKAGV